MIAKVWKVIGSPVTLAVGILLLAGSALLGNVFQNADRSSIRGDLAAAKAQNDALQDQLDEVKGQQECRSRIASESELYSGRLLVALGELVTATRNGDERSSDIAEDALALATLALTPALDARTQAVEICEVNPDYRSPEPPTAVEAAPPETATPTATVARRSTPTSRSAVGTTSTTGTTTTTVRPTTTAPPPPRPLCSVLFLPIPC